MRHLPVETFVGIEIVEMLRNSIVVARRRQVTRLAVLDLERDSSSTAGDDRLSGVERFRDFDFETLARRKLDSDTSVGHQCVKH
jgi:hypothetical protein